MRLGLCCLFENEPISFRRATARYARSLNSETRQALFRSIAEHNAESLRAALLYCVTNGIGSFRVNSQILPLCTHPDIGYAPGDVGDPIVGQYRSCGRLAQENNVRLTFHPDQFVVLSTPNPKVLENSLRELESQAQVADWLGADVINIHAGGGYGDKRTAIHRFTKAFERLSSKAQSLLCVENDDRIFLPSDLIPICRALQIPFVYDVHHHRCAPDHWTEEQATEQAARTWNHREPLFHVSSPKNGWGAGNPRPHHDFVRLGDVPRGWESIQCTVEVEAKAKELAIKKLQKGLLRRARRETKQGLATLGPGKE